MFLEYKVNLERCQGIEPCKFWSAIKHIAILYTSLNNQIWLLIIKGLIIILIISLKS